MSASLGGPEPPESPIDGAALRALRHQHNVSLRMVAELAGTSHGHLSKVERGEYGRPVTPAIVAAYEQALGTSLAHGEPADIPGQAPGPGLGLGRKAYIGQIAAVALGAPLGTRLDVAITQRCRLPLPATVDGEQVSQLPAVADVLDSLEGPLLPGLLARAALKVVVDLLDRAESEQTCASLYAVAARLATRAAWAAIEFGDHAAARNLHLVALRCAAAAETPDLRAQVVAGIADHLHTLEYHRDAQEVARLGEIDERIGDETRKLLHEIKTRAADARQTVVSQALEDPS